MQEFFFKLFKDYSLYLMKQERESLLKQVEVIKEAEKFVAAIGLPKNA